MKSRLVVVPCLLYGILVTCDCSLATDVDAGVLRRIQQRYRDIPVIAMEYTVRSEPPWADEPSIDRYLCVLDRDLDRNRFYTQEHIEESGSPKFERCWTGNTMMTFDPRRQEGHIYSEIQVPACITYIQHMFAFEEDNSYAFDWEEKPEVFSFSKNESDQIEVIESSEASMPGRVARSRRAYTIDPDLGYAIRRWDLEGTLNGERTVKVSIIYDDFKLVEGCYVATNIRKTSWLASSPETPSSTTEVKTELLVHRIDIDNPVDVKRLKGIEYPEGARIYDRRRTESVRALPAATGREKEQQWYAGQVKQELRIWETRGSLTSACSGPAPADARAVSPASRVPHGTCAGPVQPAFQPRCRRKGK